MYKIQSEKFVRINNCGFLCCYRLQKTERGRKGRLQQERGQKGREGEEVEGNGRVGNEETKMEGQLEGRGVNYSRE